MTTLIPIWEPEDLDDAMIAHGQANPDARWYIIRRAKALGLDDRVPEEWIRDHS